jgi:multidrug efflux system outer membrane protein
LTLAAKPLEGAPPLVPAGLPADLLRRRPDVAGAEQDLVSANAQVGVADASFKPSLVLTGSAGFESLDIEHALDWPNRLWSIGAALTAPIFEGGKLDAALEQAKAQYDERLATYRSTILTAYREVEDSLTDLHRRADAADAQERAVESSREYLRLARLQYDQGLFGYLQVIDAERTLLTNALQSAQIRGERYVSTVLLIKALGGGWTPSTSLDDPRTQTAVGPP